MLIVLLLTLVTIELVANNVQNTASYEVQHDGGEGGGGGGFVLQVQYYSSYIG